MGGGWNETVCKRFHIGFLQVNGKECSSYSIVSQLIWREFFYCMSANNPFYAEMDRNPICIDIPWYD